VPERLNVGSRIHVITEKPFRGPHK